MKTMNKSISWIKKLALTGTILLGTLATSESAFGQQLNRFQTGINFNVRGPYGSATLNPYQEMMMKAMRQQQYNLNNFGTSIQLEAAQIYAQRMQYLSIIHAQQAQRRAQEYYKAAQQLREEYKPTPYQYKPVSFPRRSFQFGSSYNMRSSSTSGLRGSNWQ
jgi:hypothetical protein